MKLTRKCGICGNEINLVLDIQNLVYDEKYKRFSHLECQRQNFLTRKRGRMSPEETEQAIEEMSLRAREMLAKRIENKHPEKDKSSKKRASSDPRKLLTDYLMQAYDVICLPKYIFVKLASVYDGSYNGLRQPCPPEDLLSMWQQKQEYLNKVYARNVQKGTEFTSVGRINYDLAILLNKYGDYLAWKEKQSLALEKQQSASQVDYEKIIGTKQPAKQKENTVVVADLLDEI